MPKPTLLLISATYVVDENRKKLAHLAEHFDLVCVTCTEAASLGFHATLNPSAEPLNYLLIGLHTIGAAHTSTRYVFRGLRRVFRGRRFDFILVESEPWAWVRWQAWCWKKLTQPAAFFGEFSWENLPRPGWRGRILAAIYRAAVWTDDFVIAGNSAAGELFRRAGLPASRLLIAPQLGVDETALHPLESHARAAQRASEQLSPDAMLIGFCGRFVEEKGVLDLVAAVDAVRDHNPLLSIELALLGAGPLRARLEALATARPWLRLLRSRPHVEVAAFMKMLDLFVLPSKARREEGSVWEEQFGHVLIEAMMCGVACIGSDSGEIPNVIGEPEAIFRAGDRSALAEKIEWLACNERARSENAEKQRARTLALYTNRALSENWAGFLTHLPR